MNEDRLNELLDECIAEAHKLAHETFKSSYSFMKPAEEGDALTITNAKDALSYMKASELTKKYTEITTALIKIQQELNGKTND